MPVRTEVIGYSGIEKGKSFERDAKLGKNLSDVQLEAKMSLLVPALDQALHPVVFERSSDS